MQYQESDLEEERSVMGSIHGSQYVRLDIPSLAATIQERLKETPQYSRKRCIYRVPYDLRRINEQSYTPLLVSIGPLHHNDNRLLPMEDHKLKYLQLFLGDPQAKAVDLLNLCLGIVKNKETQIRECYADPINLSSDDFAQMVLIDSAFIIQLFRRIPIEDVYMYNKPFLLDTVLRDIKLEENQLPFFILYELYCTAFQTDTSSSNSVPSFKEIACRGLNVNRDSNTNVSETHYCHLLHMFAFHKNPPIITNTTADKGTEKMNMDFVFPPATELHEAGVKFQVIKDSSSSFNIDFDEKKGILKMLKLRVDDYTEDMWRNLVAFEQCNYDFDDIRFFTDYHIFLNCLINTPEDVQLLAEAGIIQNLIGSPKQVSDLINSLALSTCISLKGYYYGKISLQLQGHCKKRWNQYRATLMHTYFNHPWAAISVAYAIVLLLLTVIQVVVGIMAIP